MRSAWDVFADEPVAELAPVAELTPGGPKAPVSAASAPCGPQNSRLGMRSAWDVFDDEPMAELAPVAELTPGGPKAPVSAASAPCGPRMCRLEPAGGHHPAIDLVADEQHAFGRTLAPGPFTLIESKKISKKHAEVVLRSADDSVLFVDCSTNGTFINGICVQQKERIIRDGDEIAFSCPTIAAKAAKAAVELPRYHLVQTFSPGADAAESAGTLSAVDYGHVPLAAEDSSSEEERAREDAQRVPAGGICPECGGPGASIPIDGELWCERCAPMEEEEEEEEGEEEGGVALQPGQKGRGGSRGGSSGGSGAEIVVDRERRMRSPSTEAWSTSFDEATQAKVDKLSPADQHLYRVCVAHGWTPSFVWLPHQPAAVRFCAGIDERWPHEYPPATYPVR